MCTNITKVLKSKIFVPGTSPSMSRIRLDVLGLLGSISHRVNVSINSGSTREAILGDKLSIKTLKPSTFFLGLDIETRNLVPLVVDKTMIALSKTNRSNVCHISRTSSSALK
eukprot:TRINITY_DN6035_c0_g2_i2.p2 TRINITY_DN6035_c0_g2~~TRINITY_DN6035_c0_g2_i2.p2  ORF type:complete len:112 (-),score=3.31 TRINITY_DN6035_c0_g2_i2:182-517(-)